MKLSTVQHARIASLLAAGVQRNVVADAIGVSPGRLTQMIESDAALQGAMVKQAAAKVDAVLAKDADLEQAEKRIIQVLPALIEECSSLSEGVRALQILNELRARNSVAMGGQLPGEVSGSGGTSLQLNLNEVAQMQISVVLGRNRAIIELGGQSVLPMPRDTVERFLNDDSAPDSASSASDGHFTF